jgi:hypothetical protein
LNLIPWWGGVFVVERIFCIWLGEEDYGLVKKLAEKLNIGEHLVLERALKKGLKLLDEDN